MLQPTSGRQGFGYVNDKGTNEDPLKFSLLIDRLFQTSHQIPIRRWLILLIKSTKNKNNNNQQTSVSKRPMQLKKQQINYFRFSSFILDSRIKIFHFQSILDLRFSTIWAMQRYSWNVKRTLWIFLFILGRISSTSSFWFNSSRQKRAASSYSTTNTQGRWSFNRRTNSSCNSSC